MKKKIASLLLALVFCMGLLPAALAANAGETLTAEEAESKYGISISPSSIDLGTIYNTPAKEERTFTVTNNGDVDVAVAKSGGTGILSSGNKDSDAYLIKAGESRDYTFSINTYTPQKGSGTIDLLVIIEPEKVGSWKTSFYYESYTTGERCTIKDALTVHYDLRALSDADAGDIAWEVSDTFIDFGTSDVADGHHPSQEKALTVTNRGSLPFVFEAVFDLSACERANKKDLFYKGISGAGSFVRPGESTKIRVSTASGYQIPGKVEGCVLKLTAYYPDSKEKNTLTAEIPLSIKFLSDGGYRIRNLSDSTYGKVSTADGVDRRAYSGEPSFIVKEGSDLTFVMTPYNPATHYVSDIKINGESVGTAGMVGNTYTISNVQASMDFEAFFAPGATPDAPKPIVGNPQPADWAKADAERAKTLGILPAALQNAYDQPITRAQFCVLADGLYTKVKGGMASADPAVTFADTTDPAVLRMASVKVVNGVGNGAFDPDGQLTREQAATMLARLSAVLDKPLTASEPTFADNADVAGWAMPFVGQMQASGIMGGTGNNQFSPKQSYTREQSVVTIMRLYGMIK